MKCISTHPAPLLADHGRALNDYGGGHLARIELLRQEGISEGHYDLQLRVK